MIPADPQAASITPPPTIPPAAVALCAASLLTVFMLAHHPVAEHHVGAAMLADLVRLGDAAARVHTMIIALVCALLYGVVALALRLDLRRPAVAFGLAAYGMGCAAMIGAMLLDGFATSAMAGWLLARGAATPDIASLALIAIGIQLLTRAGFVAMGVGIACLSWSRARSTRLLAALALPAGLLPVLAVACDTNMVPHSLIVLTGLQAAWYAGAAWTLWRGFRR